MTSTTRALQTPMRSRYASLVSPGPSRRRPLAAEDLPRPPRTPLPPLPLSGLFCPVQVQSARAIVYSDSSVLERHHLACAFELMRDDGFNVLSGLALGDYQVRALPCWPSLALAFPPTPPPSSLLLLLPPPPTPSYSVLPRAPPPLLPLILRPLNTRGRLFVASSLTSCYTPISPRTSSLSPACRRSARQRATCMQLAASKAVAWETNSAPNRRLRRAAHFSAARWRRGRLHSSTRRLPYLDRARDEPLMSRGPLHSSTLSILGLST